MVESEAKVRRRSSNRSSSLRLSLVGFPGSIKHRIEFLPFSSRATDARLGYARLGSLFPINIVSKYSAVHAGFILYPGVNRCPDPFWKNQEGVCARDYPGVSWSETLLTRRAFHVWLHESGSMRLCIQICMSPM